MLHKRDIRGYCSSSTHGESGNRVYELSTQQSDMEMSDLVESGEHKIMIIVSLKYMYVH